MEHDLGDYVEFVADRGPLYSISEFSKRIFPKFHPQQGELTTSLTDIESSSNNEQTESVTIGQEHTYEYETYYPLVDKNEVQINPNYTFDSLQFYITGRKGVNDITVQAVLLTETGETIEQNIQVKDGDFNGVGPIPVQLSGESPVDSAKIKVTYGSRDKNKISTTLRNLNNLASRDPIEFINGPMISLPATRNVDAGPPIFYFSIDTFRADFIETFSKVIDEMDDGVIPSEPRTQAEATSPVHNSIFTGTLPGKHTGQAGLSFQIKDGLQTIPEFLSEIGYKCSGITSNLNLSNRPGLISGFHRYQKRQMDWKNRTQDAQDVINQLEEWILQDYHSSNNANGLFYFAQIFDAHYPYFPPEGVKNDSTIDNKLLDEFRFESNFTESDHQGAYDYLDILDADLNPFTNDEIDYIKSLYRRSLEYISEELVKFIRELKRLGIYSESFVIISGDHGEEFFERGFGSHITLYDANIRPGMIIKPPESYNFHIPNKVDLIDIFPTIAKMTSGTIPDQIDGTPLQNKEDESPTQRLAERIYYDSYSISVEIFGSKAIFTYETNYPERPTKKQIQNGPIRSEVYELDSVRNSNYNDVSSRISEEILQDLQKRAEKVMHSSSAGRVKEQSKVDLEVKQRMKDMGYL